MELHLEVNESLSLEEAHRQATGFERALHEAIPGLTRIVTHLEPTGRDSAMFPAEPASQEQVQQLIEDFFRAGRSAARPHDIEVQRTGQELFSDLGGHRSRKRFLTLLPPARLRSTPSSGSG